MSASLVGSEMCIRDRFRQRGGTRNVAAARRALPGAQVHCMGHALGAGSVSYTHLTLPTICSV
eukprot:9914946-Alexandrium_andersonii.AAC.1